MTDCQGASEDNDPRSSGSGLKNPILTDGLVIIVRAGVASNIRGERALSRVTH